MADPLWIIIADGEHARIVAPDGTNALRRLASLDAATADSKAADLVSDRQGRTFESAGPMRHAYTPRSDPKELARHDFARLVAEQVNEAADRFARLVLVAPPDILALLQDRLVPPVRARLAGTLAKDLVHVPEPALQPHLAEWVAPVLRGP
jgi:protein required for attachment to host cells